MTTSVVRKIDRTKPYTHSVELRVDYDPLSGLTTVNVWETRSQHRAVRCAHLQTDGVIDAGEMHELLALLDTRADLMLRYLLDVQNTLF